MLKRTKAILCIVFVVLFVGAGLGGYSLARINMQQPEPAASSSPLSSVAPESSAPTLPEDQTEHSGYGEPDNSEYNVYYSTLTRVKDWKQIVTDSPFQLGKPSKQQTSYGAYPFSWGTYPVLDGSTVSIPMAVEFARQHWAFTDKNIDSMFNFSTTHEAYQLLIEKSNFEYGEYYDSNENVYEAEDAPLDLIIATEPSDGELALAKRNGVTLVTKPVCYDAFVFITHKENPIESLTMEQIQKIYAGEITNWKEIGGFDAPIVAYQREEDSGSQTAMENLLMRGKPLIDAPTVVIFSMSGLVDAVAEYQNRLSSLGYSYKYYIDNFYPDKAIKAIAIEGVEPTAENIRSGAYPLSTNYYGVIRAGDENKTGGKFLDWMLSAEGQACIAQAGYIPMDKVG